jgi:hypothetical protein
MSKVRLGHYERRVLLRDLSARYIQYFNSLERDVMDLDVMSFFDCHYRELFCLMFSLERQFPSVDESSLNYRISHCSKNLG